MCIRDSGKYSRTSLIINCLEKVFTLAKEVNGLTLNTFKQKMESILNSRLFDEKLSQFQLPSKKRYHSVEDIKKALYMMLDIVNSRDFIKITGIKNDFKSGELRFLKQRFVKDLTELSLGISGEEIMNSEHFDKEPELQKMIQDVIKKML